MPAGEKKERSVMTSTPRPWVIGQFSVTGLHYYIDAANDDQVADVYEFDDAALCVRAVNSHDALVAALEDLADVQNGPPLLKYEEAWNAAMAKVWAALALVKGTDRD